MCNVYVGFLSTHGSLFFFKKIFVFNMYVWKLGRGIIHFSKKVAFSDAHCTYITNDLMLSTIFDFCFIWFSLKKN